MESLDALSTQEFAEWWRKTGERELRQVLYWRWDPIGVSREFPYATDEYDGYAPQIVSALRARATQDEIADALRSIEKDQMGLATASAEHLGAVAAYVVEWYENSQKAWRAFGPLRR
ncbi:MAG TPA: hypothetical protein VHM72_07825 [Solirubrobacteraceae bacterium]|nr:hypothetical protein [Solirubrobacteraceae bacterium]